MTAGKHNLYMFVGIGCLLLTGMRVYNAIVAAQTLSWVAWSIATCWVAVSMIKADNRRNECS